MSNDQLQAIERWASLLFSMEQVRILVQADKEAWNNDMAAEGEAWTAYQRGKLKQEAQIRQSLITLATQGSAPAQKEVLGIIANTDNLNI
jgi:hypothetical protein